jgi:hypothetical protein
MIQRNDLRLQRCFNMVGTHNRFLAYNEIVDHPGMVIVRFETTSQKNDVNMHTRYLYYAHRDCSGCSIYR